MRVRQGKKLQWQFPIVIETGRSGWRWAILITFQAPLVRRLEFEMLNLSGWLGDEDLDE
jgi:hypothetical protein